MVKITQVYLIKHLNLPRYKNEKDADVLKRLSHLKLQNKYVDCIDKLPDCINVRIIYLQNNLLTKPPSLDYCNKLTHLYLQRNKISKMDNFDNLVSLKKLYLGYNSISVIEGLDNVRNLCELHVEHQNLPSGESVHFHPRTINNLAGTIEVINVSGCGLTTLSVFSNMKYLKELIATDNLLNDLQDMKDVLPSLPSLFRITLAGNQVAQLREFVDTAVHCSRNLCFIDNTEINPTRRKFVDGWKTAQTSQMQQKIGSHGDDISLKDSKVVHFFPPESASAQIKPDIGAITNEPVTYPPWKLRKNVNCSGGTHRKD